MRVGFDGVEFLGCAFADCLSAAEKWIYEIEWWPGTVPNRSANAASSNRICDIYGYRCPPGVPPSGAPFGSRRGFDPPNMATPKLDASLQEVYCFASTEEGGIWQDSKGGTTTTQMGDHNPPLRI